MPTWNVAEEEKKTTKKEKIRLFVEARITPAAYKAKGNNCFWHYEPSQQVTDSRRKVIPWISEREEEKWQKSTKDVRKKNAISHHVGDQKTIFGC